MYSKQDGENIIAGIVIGLIIFITILIVGAVTNTGDVSQDPDLKYTTGLEPSTYPVAPEDTDQPQPVTEPKEDHDLSKSAPPTVDIG